MISSVLVRFRSLRDDVDLLVISCKLPNQEISEASFHVRVFFIYCSQLWHLIALMHCMMLYVFVYDELSLALTWTNYSHSPA